MIMSGFGTSAGIKSTHDYETAVIVIGFWLP
jgi:hypothetical protein